MMTFQKIEEEIRNRYDNPKPSGPDAELVGFVLQTVRFSRVMVGALSVLLAVLVVVAMIEFDRAHAIGGLILKYGMVFCIWLFLFGAARVVLANFRRMYCKQRYDVEVVGN